MPKLLRKLVSITSIGLILLQSVLPVLLPMSLARATYAQEATDSTPSAEIIVEPTTPEPSPDTSPSPSPEPTVEPSFTPEPTSAPESTPTPTPALTPIIEPTLTPSPTPSPELTVQNQTAPDPLTTLLNLITDKLDYSPSDEVMISGSGLLPVSVYTLTISSSDDPAVTFSIPIITDALGSFTYNYQLDGNYRPNYQVELKDGVIVVATTTFTDSSNKITTVAVTDLTPDTVIPGQAKVSLISFTVKSSDSNEDLEGVKVQYTGTDEADVTTLYLYRESGGSGGSFDPATDVQMVSDSDPGGGGEFDLNPPTPDFAMNTNVDYQFYVVADIGAGATVGNVVDVKIKKDKINFDSENWPNVAGEPVFDPAGSSTIVAANVAPSFDPIANQAVNEDASSQNVAITNVSPGPADESSQTVSMSATSSNPSVIPNPTVSGSGSTRTLAYAPVANASGTATITVTANDGQSQNNTFSRTFTITVVANGHIVIVKDAITNNAQDFTFQNNFGNGNPDTFQLDDDSNATLPDNRSFEVLPGSYSVSEDAVAGWKLSSATCDDGSSIDSINVSAGETVTCTFVNKELATIVLVKNTLGGDGAFDFVMTGTTLPSSTQLTTSGGTVQQTFNDIDPDNIYTIAETPVPAGWDLTSTTCTGTNTVGSITPNNGEVITCTFTNTKLGTIIVEKQTDPDNASGGFTFTGNAGGTISDNDQIIVSDLFPGTYTSTEDDPTPSFDLTSITCDDGNSTGSLDNKTATFNLEAGEVVTCAFTNTQRGSISGAKYEVNSDLTPVGTLFGWIIRLLGGEGELDSTTTDGVGAFSFNNLAPGVYWLVEDIVTGWTQIFSPPAVILTAGVDLEENDFGNFQNGTIRGVKFDDLDGDGRWDEGEPALSEWRMFIDENDDGQFDEEELSILTTESGYSFTNLPPGTYQVCEEEQGGWTRTTPENNCETVELDVSGEVEEVNFGNFQLGRIRGEKFEDVNGDGQPDEGEPRLAGWTIFIDSNDNGQLDEGEVQAITNEDGRFGFDGLTAGTYRVREVLQDGWAQTAPEDGNFTFEITSGADFGGVYFGNFKQGEIHGVKFEDTNGDSVRDEGEPGLEDWTIYLDVNENGEFDDGEPSTTTDEDGAYEFTGLSAGTYRVREVLQDGWTQTRPETGEYVDEVTSGSVFEERDFGNFQDVTITVYKWEDWDGDGEWDEGEPFIGDWPMSDSIVTTRTSSGTDGVPFQTEIVELQLTSVTDSENGQVNFKVSKPGTHRIEEGSKDNFQRTYPVDSFFDIFVEFSGQNITEDKDGHPLRFGNVFFEELFGGMFAPTNGNIDSTPGVTILGDTTITVPEDGANTISFLDKTVITRSDGENFDISDLSGSAPALGSLTGLGSGVVADGALQWGLIDLGLEFSQPITVSIFVGTSFNGQTLNVLRSTSGSSGWTNDGIVAPATCTVIDGFCTFQATKASFYAATHTTSTGTTAGTSTTDGGGGGDGGAAACGDTKPSGAPTLTAAIAGVNSVTLVWTQAAAPVSYYLVTYGESSGAQTYGNPNVGGAGTTSYTIAGLSGGTTYYFKVRAGNGCMPGDYSSEISATPTGGFVAGPAAGFAPGVLGATTEVETAATPAATPSEKPKAGEVLGGEKKQGEWTWWWVFWGIIGLGGLGLVFWLRRRGQTGEN